MNTFDDFHSVAEARSWALHREVAARIVKQPELLERAKERVRGWVERPAEHPYAMTWKALLEGPPEELQAALVGKDSGWCTLRQASPFAGALDSATRWRILKQPGLRSGEKS